MASSNNPFHRKDNSTVDKDKSEKNREERPNPFQEESNKYRNPFGSSDGYEDYNEGLLPFEEHPSVGRYIKRPQEQPPPPPLRSSSLVEAENERNQAIEAENEKNREISNKYIMSYQPPKEGKKD